MITVSRSALYPPTTALNLSDVQYRATITIEKDAHPATKDKLTIQIHVLHPPVVMNNTAKVLKSDTNQ